MNFKSLFSALFLVLASAALADDANWAAIGSAGNFSKSKSVEMLRETVNIAMDDDGMHVNATFWFKNHGGAQTVQMGFPDYTSNANWDIDAHRKVNVIKWFKSKVDGADVKVTRVPTKGGSDEYNSAWVKKVPFGAGQTRRVDVEYFARHGFAGNGWIFDSYILETGSTWKGPIGSGKVSVDWSKMGNYSKPRLEAGHGAHLVETDGRHATLTFSNLKPKFNLMLTMVTGFFNFRMNGKTVPNGRGLPDQNDGPLLSGPHDDLVIPVANLGNFFALRLDGGNEDWQSPEALAFGGSLEFLPPNRVKLRNGKVKTLARPITTKDDAKFVHLKDLVVALGGTYRYNKRYDRVDLTLPVSKRK